MTITAQDFLTTELVEALTERGYFVRTLSHLDALNEAIAAERERAAAELAAMRARTIEECAAIAQSASRRAFITSHGKAGADMADAIHTAIRALATPTLTTEPAPVDPAAGALR